MLFVHIFIKTGKLPTNTNNQYIYICTRTYICVYNIKWKKAHSYDSENLKTVL